MLTYFIVSLQYEDGLKCFEEQPEDDVTRPDHSGTTIVYTLKDTCKNFNHFGHSVITVLVAVLVAVCIS